MNEEYYQLGHGISFPKWLINHAASMHLLDRGFAKTHSMKISCTYRARKGELYSDFYEFSESIKVSFRALHCKVSDRLLAQSAALAS